MEIRHTGNLKIFSETASINESSAFGTTTNTDDINTLLNTNFQKGWENGVDEDGFPLRKWFNGKDKALTKLIAYLYQQGIPAYDSTQKYYIDSVCTYNGKAYISLVGTESTPNIGNVPTSSIGTSWNPITLFASDTESQNGINDTKSITPLKLFNSLKGNNQLLNGNGFQKLHGGLIIQWGGQTISGDSNAEIFFPITFPNSYIRVFTTFENIAGDVSSDTRIGQVRTITNSKVTIRNLSGNSSGYVYFAIGY